MSTLDLGRPAQGETGVETNTVGQRYLLGLWVCLSVLTPLVGYLGARGFAPLIGIMGLLCLPLVRPTRGDWKLWGVLAALAAWAMISGLWSPMIPDPDAPLTKQLERFTGLHLALQLLLSGGFVLGVKRMSAETARSSLVALSWGMLLLAAILLVEGATQAAIYQRAQLVIHQTVRPDLAVRNVALGGYVLAVLFWPVGVMLWEAKRRIMVGTIALAVVFSTVFLRGDSPTLALGVSALAFFAVQRWGKRAVLTLGGFAVGFFLLAPSLMLVLQKIGVFGLLHNHLPASWRARLDIWSFTNARILEDPLQGWGLDASRMFPGYIHLHPHNSAVQLWFELGLIGAALGAAFWGLIFWRVAQADGIEHKGPARTFAAAACAMAMVYLLIGAISFSLWQEWWICLGAFGMAACVALRRFIGRPKPPKRIKVHKAKPSPKAA